MEKNREPGSGIGMNILDIIFKNFECQFFGLKILKFFDVVPDPRSGNLGWKKIWFGIRNTGTYLPMLTSGIE